MNFIGPYRDVNKVKNLTFISVSSADGDGTESLNMIKDKPECQTGQSVSVTGDTSPACILISSSQTLVFCQVLQPLTPPHTEKPFFPIKPAG